MSYFCPRPLCGGITYVKETQPGSVYQRIRICKSCRHRFKTVELDLAVQVDDFLSFVNDELVESLIETVLNTVNSPIIIKESKKQILGSLNQGKRRHKLSKLI